MKKYLLPLIVLLGTSFQDSRASVPLTSIRCHAEPDSLIIDNLNHELRFNNNTYKFNKKNTLKLTDLLDLEGDTLYVNLKGYTYKALGEEHYNFHGLRAIKLQDLVDRIYKINAKVYLKKELE